jgi:hypothetical protein
MCTLTASLAFTTVQQNCIMKISVFLDVTPCSMIGTVASGETAAFIFRSSTLKMDGAGPFETLIHI